MLFSILMIKMLFPFITCHSYTRFPTITDIGFLARTKRDAQQIRESDITASKTQFPDFEKVLSHPSFVDKTNFAKLILNRRHNVLLVQAPSGFGKSTIISMLERFFRIHVDSKGVVKSENKTKSNDYIIFSKRNEHTHEHLAVFKDKGFFDKHFGEYPVVRMDFSTLNLSPWYGIERRMAGSLSTLLREAYRQHDYLRYSDRIPPKCREEFIQNSMRIATCMSHVEEMIQVLFGALKTHFNKRAIILIDDMDSPISTVILSKFYCDTRAIDILSDFFGNFMKWLVKTNTDFEFAFLTGISSLYDAVYRAADNIEKTSIFLERQVAPYFGLTEAEVRDIIRRYQQEHKFEAIKAYYGGYRVNESDISLYRTTSVIKSLETNKIESFWFDKQFLSALIRVFRFKNMGESIWEIITRHRGRIHVRDVMDAKDVFLMKKLIAANSAADFKKNRLLMMRYFFENGYLALLGSLDHDGAGEVTIPNKEAMASLEKSLWRAAVGDMYKLLPFRMGNFAEALESLTEDEKSCHNLVIKVAFLVMTLIKGTNEREVTAYIYAGIRSGIEKPKSADTRHDKTRRLQVWVGHWDPTPTPAPQNNELNSSHDEGKGSTFLAFLLENPPGGGGKKSYKGFILEIQFRDVPAVEILAQILTRGYKGTLTEENTGVDPSNIKEVVYIGLNVQKVGFKVSASILFGDREIMHAINVTNQHV